jgi:DNA-binding MarR family transcriptional regulator
VDTNPLPDPAADEPIGTRLPLVRPGPYRGETYRAEDSIGFLMKVALHGIRRDVDARMAMHGLTDAQWGPLFLIVQGKGQCNSDLARASGHDSGALTRMVDRLEAKGLVKRVRSPSDRRVVRLELTPEGERAAAIVPYVIADVLNEHCAGLSPAELETLKDLLRRIIAAGGAAGSADRSVGDPPADRSIEAAR